MYIDHRILLIDDDKEDGEMIKTALAEMNTKYRLIAAQDGVEAIDRLQELIGNGELPCLIILDVNMPRMDGRETLEKIKSNPAIAKVPVVIFSTAEKFHLDAFYSASGVEIFTKPMDQKSLRKTMERFLSVCDHSQVLNNPA